MTEEDWGMAEFGEAGYRSLIEYTSDVITVVSADGTIRYQSPSSEEGKHGLDSPGTGLGLYLVDTLVERYGGDVRVEDNDPGGAVFSVSLSLAG